MKQFEKKSYNDLVMTKKVSGGRKRTYFIDVKKTRTDDLYIVMSENSNKLDGEMEKHRIFLYKEDMNRFVKALEEAAAKVREMMPDYDFDQFDGRFDTFETDFKTLEKNDDVSW